jgi:hypothetical protein
MSKLLKSYFFWTYPRGSFHYDVLVTLILLFIGVTPHLWNYGDKPSNLAGPAHPIQIVGGDSYDLVVTVHVADVNIDRNTNASNQLVRKALRKAIEPVTGDAVFIKRWETFTDPQGNAYWKVWANR